MKRHTGIASLCLALVGCTAVGPSYESPDPTLSPGFHGAGAMEKSGSVQPDWWMVLGDAQLAGYIRDAVGNIARETPASSMAGVPLDGGAGSDVAIGGKKLTIQLHRS